MCQKDYILDPAICSCWNCIIADLVFTRDEIIVQTLKLSRTMEKQTPFQQLLMEKIKLAKYIISIFNLAFY